MQGVGGTHPGSCLSFTTELARKRASNALNSLSVHVNKCQRLSEDMFRRTCDCVVMRMEPDPIISDDWSREDA